MPSNAFQSSCCGSSVSSPSISPDAQRLALVAFREPNGGDTRWPQEIHVLADIRELIFAAAVAVCGVWHMRGGGCT
jgi:hypothetical protein